MAHRWLIEPSDVETQLFDWGAIKWLSSPRANGAEGFTTGVVVLAPGKGHERHNHPGVEEILYVIAGYGEQMVEVEDDQGATKQERKAIGPGMLIHIPPDVYHETINTGWEPLKLLAVYCPPGPEEILRDLPDCQVVPPGETPTR